MQCAEQIRNKDSSQPLVHARNHQRTVVIFQFLYISIKNKIFVLLEKKSHLRSFSKGNSLVQDIFRYYESESLRDMSSSEMTKFTCLIDSNKQYNLTIFLTNGIINAQGVIKIVNYEKVTHTSIVIVMTVKIYTPVHSGEWQCACVYFIAKWQPPLTFLERQETWLTHWSQRTELSSVS